MIVIDAAPMSKTQLFVIRSQRLVAGHAVEAKIGAPDLRHTLSRLVEQQRAQSLPGGAPANGQPVDVASVWRLLAPDFWVGPHQCKFAYWLACQARQIDLILLDVAPRPPLGIIPGAPLCYPA